MMAVALLGCNADDSADKDVDPENAEAGGDAPDGDDDVGGEGDDIPDEGWAPEPPAEGGAIDIADIHRRRAEATCQALAHCQATGVIEQRHGADCAGGLEHQIRQLYGNAVDEAVAEGRVSYDPEAAWRCVRGTLVAPCNLFETEPSCGAVYVGTAAIGQPCVIDLECEGAAWCDATSECPGLCRQARSIGSGCTADRQCGGLASCRLGSCQEKLRLDDPCSSDGAQCVGLLSCSRAAVDRPATFCRNPFEGHEPGQSCRPAGCQAGLYCRFASDLDHRCDTQQREGETCFHGSPNACTSGLICDFEGLAPRPEVPGECKPAPVQGELCWVDCTPGHVCAHTEPGDPRGECQAMRDNGQECTTSEHCWSLTCDSTAGVCRARAKACLP